MSGEGSSVRPTYPDLTVVSVSGPGVQQMVDPCGQSGPRDRGTICTTRDAGTRVHGQNSSRKPINPGTPDMTDGTLFTTYTLADYLQVSPRTVQREVARGRLPYVMVGGRRRYRRADVEKYLHNRLQRSRFRVIHGGRSRIARTG